MFKLFGVSGLNASGKSTLCNYLKNRFEKNSQTFCVVLSLSNVIREELARLKLPETRENLIGKANQLRNEFGTNILSIRLIEKIDAMIEKNKQEQIDHSYFIIDSMRHPDEVNIFREKYPSQFTLIGIQCDPMKRFQRLKERNRIGDIDTFEKFQEIEKKETANSDPKGQQVDKVFEMLDVLIENDFETIEELEDEIEKKIDELEEEES